MSRKSQLIAEYKRLLKHVRTGKLSTRQERLRGICTIINDLYALPHLPSSLQALTQADIKNLIASWQKRGLSPTTMINKLAMLRFLDKHLGLAEPIPTNRELGLKKQTAYCPISNINVMNGYLAMENTIAKTIFGMVLHFGMTFREVVHCVPLHHFEEKYVSITRDIAFNGKERYIPIITDSQKQLIMKMTHLLEPQMSLYQRWPYNTLLAVYHAELTLQGLPHVQYRHYYTCIRYQQLHKSHSKKDCLDIIKQEMGFYSNTPLRYYLHTNIESKTVQYEQNKVKTSHILN